MPFDPLWQDIVMEWLDYAQQELGFKPDDPIFPKQAVVCNPVTLQFEVKGLSREHTGDSLEMTENKAL